MYNQHSCVGCGLVSANVSGPSHTYLLSSSTCWQYYTEVLAREFNNELYYVTNRLTVDTYALQHPGDTTARAIQSVSVHLASLYAVLKLKKTHEFATQLINLLIKEHKKKFIYLAPPIVQYKLTVHDIWQTNNTADHVKQVYEWAQQTLYNWRDYYSYIEELLKVYKLI